MSFRRHGNTTNTRRLAHENIRSEMELEKELSRLEKERAATIRGLDNETKLFCLNSSSSTKTTDFLPTSPRLVSASFQKPGFRKASVNGTTDIQELYVPLGTSYKLARSYENLSTQRELTSPRTRSISPRVIHRDSSFTSSDSSPSSSPEAKRRLSMSILHGSASFHDNSGLSAQRSPRAISGSGQIPQIVISDAGSSIFPRQGSDVALDLYKESLHIPVTRARSSSVPSANQLPVKLGPAPSESGQSSARMRSSSISAPSDTYPRGITQRGSVSSRTADHRGPSRRSSIAVDYFIHDLSRGIDHMGIHHNERRVPQLSSEEWESLKSCRYLRMPNQS